MADLSTLTPFSTLVELFDHAIRTHAASEAFGTKKADGTWSWLSYRDFGRLVEAARGGLAARGVGTGDKVAIISDNRVEWAVLAFATYTLGAAFVPMYEAQHPEEWTYILSDSGAKLVVAAKRSIYDTLEAERRGFPAVTSLICFEAVPREEDSYERLLEDGRAAPVPAAAVTKDMLASVIYTSGTTGEPKGVELSHDNQASNTMAAAQRFTFYSDDRSLAFLPWAHVFGQTSELFSLLYFGAALAINDAIPNIVGNLAVVRPTVLVAVPRIFNRIYDGVNKQMTEKPSVIRKLFSSGIAASAKKRRGEALGFGEKLALAGAEKLIFTKVRARFGGRLRFVVSGSAALAPEVGEFIDALGIDVFEGYGLTETSPVISANYPGHRKLGSVGPTFPGVSVKIDREATGDEKHGEIICYGPGVMVGYHNKPEETAKVMTADGGLRTGDMGYLDADGYLFITGRIKEQYKLENGKYVVPSPLEERLKLSPYIVNCMVTGINRPYNVVLIVPDVAAVNEWAKGRGLTLGDLTTSPEVKKLLQSEVDRLGEVFKSYERPRDLAVTVQDFTQENGMLTPKMSLKRRKVMEVFGAVLERLYKPGGAH